MSVGQVLGGLMRGVGTYLVEDARAQREAALERLRQDRADQRTREGAQLQNKFQLQQIEAQGQEQRQTLGINVQAQARERAEQRAFERSQQEDRQSHETALENLQHTHGMTRLQREEANLLARQALERDEEVAEYQITAQGALIGLNARGQIVARSRRGVYNPENQPRGRTNRPAQALSAPAPAPAPPRNTARVGAIVEGPDGRRYQLLANGQLEPLN